MDINPIGAAARTFLRRVHLAEEPLYACQDELSLAQACEKVGYLQAVGGRDDTFDITPRGLSYLNALARAH